MALIMLNNDLVGAVSSSLLFAGDSMEDIDRRGLRRLMHIMERFRQVRSTMPVHLVEALLRVALDEGKSVKYYAEQAAVSTSVMSRHLLDLGSEFRNGDAGLGLIAKRTSGHSLREQEVYLTPKGRKEVNQVISLLIHGTVDKGT
jgi:DNA-binding MarR family transcriptional regulator